MLRHISRILAIGFTMSAAVGAYAGGHEITPDAILGHISVLAHDSLEGRLVGEAGEWKASEYIIGQFETAGLLPGGPDGNWRQEFEFTKVIKYGENNHLTVNGVDLEINTEWKPMKQSGSLAFEFDSVVPVGFGIQDEEGYYDDYEGLDVSGKAVLISRYAPDEENPHFDFDKYSSLAGKIRTAIEQDAGGVFFYTPLTHDDTLIMAGMTRVSPKDIPIIFLRRAAFEKLGLSLEDPSSFAASGQTELIPVRDTGYNALGYLRGQTDTMIIIGAHYDHLGYGGPGSGSRYLGPEKLVHNGADDNGSGTAAVLELAHYFAGKDSPPYHSMLFVAFSGEEHGLLGSSSYVRDPVYPLENVRLMINMDMIGRLRNQDKGLAVFGTGTAEEFAPLFDTLSSDKLRLVSKESGTGPSDHTAFYNREIPVLGFFTGAHEDYHKPADDIEHIDADGIVSVAGLVASVVGHFESHPAPLTFQKTKDPKAGQRMGGFSVTLGIMPDYISEVTGLRIDGVSPDRPADRAGLEIGDIITKMGDYQVSDIYEYMDALRKFRKGDTATVVIERDGETQQADVVF